MSDDSAWRPPADGPAAGWSRPSGPGPGDPTLRLPAPPPPVYPRIPGTASARPAAQPPDRTPRILLLALLAGLIGALLGSGTAFVAIDRATPAAADRPAEPARRLAAPPIDAGESPAPPEASPSAAPTPSPAQPGGELDRVATVAAAVLPAVVQVNIDGTEDFAAASGNGSGVIYRADGYIVTNNHVVSGAGDLEVVFADRSAEPAQVVGTDPDNDLAVIKVDVSDLPAIEIGDSSRLVVGQLAVAVGSPFGLEGSVTAGVISALDRPIDIRAPDGRPVRLPNVIQTDAPINPGNSGGALVGGDGRLIGINSAILTAGQPANAGVGFAIPASTVVDIADELIDNGFVRHPFLGVRGNTLNRETADRLGVEKGVFIEVVQEGTPAAEAGLRAGDVVVAVDGTPVESMDDLFLAVRDSEVGAAVTIDYVRNGEERTTEAVLAEAQQN